MSVLGGWVCDLMDTTVPHVVGVGQLTLRFFWLTAEVGVPGVDVWILVYIHAIDRGEYHDLEWLKGVVTNGERFYDSVYRVNVESEIGLVEMEAVRELLVAWAEESGL